MLKKIMGGLLILEAILAVVGMFMGGSFGGDLGSSAANIGYIVGSVIPVIALIAGGIFLLLFDSVRKKDIRIAVKKRNGQCGGIIFFFVVFLILLFFAAIGVGLSNSGMFSSFLLNFLIAILPYLFPFMVYAFMLTFYCVPYFGWKKSFPVDEAALDYYLNPAEVFRPLTKDGFVVASDKAICFPTRCVFLPFDAVESVRQVVSLPGEHDITFTLNNGKKFMISSLKKCFDEINGAFNAGR